MTKPAAFIWTLMAPVLTGMAIIVLLLVPAAQPKLGMWIVAAAVACCIVAVPLAMKVGKAME